MSTREQFGKYLLLKKLTEDPLGETFRAGRLGDKGMERVALLRIFNGQGLDGQRLWQACRDRAPIQPKLRSPNLGEGIEMGEIQGIPYVAYEYVSGKNLASLLEQAAKKQNFIPAEHALLITERVALGLAVASEIRLGGQRILHGFLIPHLVMISNEGETRLLGHEVAPGLRSFAGNPVVRQHFGRYLAPEALAGAAPDRTDDIFSLGVLLFELLTGRPLPPPAPEGFGPIIEQGQLATEGKPIQPELQNLLKRSLVAREHRISDVVTWHKALNKWMFDGQYNPTTFNLAFYMHNLFRQEIELESQEIEVERTLPVPIVAAPPQPPPQPAPAAVPAAAPPASEATGVHEGTGVRPPEPEPAKKSNMGVLIGIAALLLAIAGGAFWWLGQQKTPASGPAVATQPQPPPPPLPVEVDTGPSPEEVALQEKIESLIAQRANALEAQIRSDYDSQLQDLEKQLQDAKNAKERERRRREEEQAAREQAEREAQEKADLEAAAAAELAAAEAAAQEELTQKPPEETVEEPVEVAEAQEPAEEVVAPPPPPPPPPEVQVRRGDLVTPGAGVVSPTALRMIQPRFPELARRVNKKGATVLIRVLIDENGRVLEAELAGKKQGFGFDAEALQAARKSTYNPATKNGVPVKIWHTISVVFQQ